MGRAVQFNQFQAPMMSVVFAMPETGAETKQVVRPIPDPPFLTKRQFHRMSHWNKVAYKRAAAKRVYLGPKIPAGAQIKAVSVFGEVVASTATTTLTIGSISATN